MSTEKIATSFMVGAPGNWMVIFNVRSLHLGESAGSPLSLLKKVPLPAAPGGSEYVDTIPADADARRVYVSDGAEVDVLRLSAGFGLTIPGSATTDRNQNFSSMEKK